MPDVRMYVFLHKIQRPWLLDECSAQSHPNVCMMALEQPTHKRLRHQLLSKLWVISRKNSMGHNCWHLEIGHVVAMQQLQLSYVVPIPARDCSSFYSFLRSIITFHIRGWSVLWDIGDFLVIWFFVLFVFFRLFWFTSSADVDMSLELHS